MEAPHAVFSGDQIECPPEEPKTRKLDEIDFNQVIETKKIIPGIEEFMGENMRFVGKSYVFLGDKNILQTIKIWASGFDPDDFEEE